MISLRQLHYFVEIVESGGFSRAAERLFVAQSALSRQVRELEDSIGTPLLRRGPLARREAPVALAALAGETFVSIPHLQRGGLSYRAAELCLGAGFYPRPARALSRKTSQLQLIEAGFGVALVPASMRAIAPPAVRFMSLAEAEAYSEVALAWRRDDSPLVEGFVEYFLENLPNEAKD